MEDPHAHPELVLATAVSEKTPPNLFNLIASLQQWPPQEHPLVVDHLGGLPLKQLEDMESWPNVRKVKWKSSLPPRYRGHNLTEDNWKAIFWNEALQEYPSASCSVSQATANSLLVQTEPYIVESIVSSLYLGLCIS
jgi:hypothetical protein